jgi:hypothetical protein
MAILGSGETKKRLFPFRDAFGNEEAMRRVRRFLSSVDVEAADPTELNEFLDVFNVLRTKLPHCDSALLRRLTTCELGLKVICCPGDSAPLPPLTRLDHLKCSLQSVG